MFYSLSDAELSIAMLFWLMFAGIVIAGAVLTYFNRKR
jgi:hypothetical protein